MVRALYFLLFIHAVIIIFYYYMYLSDKNIFVFAVVDGVFLLFFITVLGQHY